MLFVTKTTNVEDLEWLDQLIPTSKSYKKRILSDPGINFGMTWDIFEKGKMYLKIDDDVVGHSEMPIISKTAIFPPNGSI